MGNRGTNAPTTCVDGCDASKGHKTHDHHQEKNRPEIIRGNLFFNKGTSNFFRYDAQLNGLQEG